MASLNKGTLIEALAKDSGETVAATTRFLTSFINVVTANLKKGNDIGITGFGSLKAGKRAARIGRNPATGKPLKIAASKTVRFSAGATLKAAMNPTKKK